MAASLSPPVLNDQKLPQSFSKLPAVKQELSFEFIKRLLFHGRLESVECEELTRYCSKLQRKTSGTKGELIHESVFDKRVNHGKRVHCKYPPYKALGNFPKALYGGYLQCTHFPSCHVMGSGK